MSRLLNFFRNKPPVATGTSPNAHPGLGLTDFAGANSASSLRTPAPASIARPTMPAPSDLFLQRLAALLDCGPHLEEIEQSVQDLLHSQSFYKRRCDALQGVQSTMRDPERTMVCDILANGSLLLNSRGEPSAERYAQAPKEKAAQSED